MMYLGQIVEYGDTEEIYQNPLHPYTRALFSAALPSHPDLIREDIVLTGEVPSPINPPSGCRFHPRCPFAMDRCQVEVPEYKEVAPGPHDELPPVLGSADRKGAGLLFPSGRGGGSSKGSLAASAFSPPFQPCFPFGTFLLAPFVYQFFDPFRNQ